MTATIRHADLVESIAAALQYISYYHPADYIAHLARAYELEQGPAAKDAIAQILTNSKMCAEGRRPICQDTGIVNVFLKIGMDVRFEGFPGSVEDAVDDGVRKAYLDADNPLRASIVADPHFERKNTRDNTPAVVQMTLVPGNTVDVIVGAKGGGSENKSKFMMMNPSDDLVDWVLKTVPTMGAGWCPPGMLGIGIGGTAERAMLLAKQSLMEDIDMHELKAARAEEQDRGAAHRAVRQGQRARHRRPGPRRPGDRARRQDRDGADARREQARGDDPQLRRDAPRALRPRRLRPGLPRSAEPRPLARREVGARLQQVEEGRPRHADEGRGRELEAGRDAAAARQDAHRPRRRAQAHPGHARQGRAAAGRLHQPRHLLRRPGRSGARRGRRPGRPDDGDADGQVHRDDARPDRPASP